MRKTIELLNEIEQLGYFTKYAIGGAIGALFYVDPFETEDLDILILLPPQAHPLAPLSDIYEEMRRRGYREDGPYIIIEGTPVQLIPAYNQLVEESVSLAPDKLYDGVRTRVPDAEHLAAIMVQTGRTKDRIRLDEMRKQASLDEGKLLEILTRYGLRARYDQWTQ